MEANKVVYEKSKGISENRSKVDKNSDIDILAQGGEEWLRKIKRPTATPYAYNIAGRYVDNAARISVLTMDRMLREDPVISQCISTNMNIISAYIGGYKHAEEEKTLVGRGILNNIEGGFNKVKNDLLSATGYGFAVGYKVDGTFKQDGEWWNGYKRLMLLPQVSLRFCIDHEGNLAREDGIRQSIINPFQNSQLTSGYMDMWASRGNMPIPNRSMINLNVIQAELRPEECVHFALRGSNGVLNHYGESMLLPIYNDWVAKTGLEQFYLMAVERKISPLVALYCNPNNFYKDKNGSELKFVDQARIEFGDGLGDRGILYFDGMKNEQYLIETLDVIGDVEEILSAIEYKNRNIRSGLRNPSTLGTIEGGSYAMSQMQDSIWNKDLENIRDQLCHVMIEQLIKPALIKNFGELDDYGSFEIKVLGIDEKLKYAKFYETLSNSGIINSENKEHIDHILDTLNQPLEGDPIDRDKLLGGSNTNQTETKVSTGEAYAKTEAKKVN